MSEHMLTRKLARASAKIEILERMIEDRTRDLYLANMQLSRRNDELQDLRVELLSTAHRAGMSEVATGVLHNLGNAMNSVGVAVHLLRDGLQGSSLPLFTKLSAMLNGDDDSPLASFVRSDPRGQKLATSLAMIASHLNRERARQLEEIHTLVDQLEHVNAIITSQQQVARCVALRECVELPQLLARAITIGSAGFGDVRLTTDYGALPPILVDPNKVTQIVLNLLSNAKHAVLDAGVEAPLITLCAHARDGFAVISISDNGSGIAPENLSRVFEYGFSTKAHGHGFGLHISALGAREMGGTLTAASEGTGQGATFTLTLPIAAEWAGAAE